MYVIQELCEGDVVLMAILLLQEVTLADLFHLPSGSLVFDRLKLGNLDKRPHVKR
jgi:hypothetical protein